MAMCKYMTTNPMSYAIMKTRSKDIAMILIKAYISAV